MLQIFKSAKKCHSTPRRSYHNVFVKIKSKTVVENKVIQPATNTSPAQPVTKQQFEDLNGSSDGAGHVSVVQQICVKDKCPTIICPGLCDNLLKELLYGHLSTAGKGASASKLETDLNAENKTLTKLSDKTFKGDAVAQYFVGYDRKYELTLNKVISYPDAQNMVDAELEIQKKLKNISDNIDNNNS